LAFRSGKGDFSVTRLVAFLIAITFLVSATVPVKSAPGAQSGCTAVELYPGYPGYAGYVTGVFGYGDYACLEELTRQYPNFSKSVEDERNLAAARTLGIAGGFADFTWENWLQIEAERDLPPTCYFCARRDALAHMPPMEPPYDSLDPLDPRLLLGGPDSASLVFQYTDARGGTCLTPNTTSYRYFAANQSDFDFRVLGTLGWTDGYANAAEVYDSVFALFDWVCDPANAGSYLDPGKLLNLILERGSWFPMPPTAAPDDQVFGIVGAIYSTRAYWDQTRFDMLQSRLQAEIDVWYTQVMTGGTTSFAEHLRESNWL
jgi:hypothetical protein